jgi:hypothetical protein
MKDPKIYLQQRALRDMGFYHLSLDGDNGPATRAAYSAWLASVEPSTSPSFEATVTSWGLKYFTASELLTKGAAHSRNGLNTDPPRSLWPNIRDAALAADEARRRLGSGIIITSAYRSPAYNSAIRGASGSLHLQFRALDLIPIRATVSELHTVLRQLRQDGFRGARGIGRYNTFCHIDNASVRDWG